MPDVKNGEMTLGDVRAELGEMLLDSDNTRQVEALSIAIQHLKAEERKRMEKTSIRIDKCKKEMPKSTKRKLKFTKWISVECLLLPTIDVTIFDRHDFMILLRWFTLNFGVITSPVVH